MKTDTSRIEETVRNFQLLRKVKAYLESDEKIMDFNFFSILELKEVGMRSNIELKDYFLTFLNMLSGFQSSSGIIEGFVYNDSKSIKENSLCYHQLFTNNNKFLTELLSGQFSVTLVCSGCSSFTKFTSFFYLTVNFSNLLYLVCDQEQ